MVHSIRHFFSFDPVLFSWCYKDDCPQLFAKNHSWDVKQNIHGEINEKKRKTHKTMYSFCFTMTNCCCFDRWVNSRYFKEFPCAAVTVLNVCVSHSLITKLKTNTPLPANRVSEHACMHMCVFRGLSVIFSVWTSIWLWKVLTSYWSPLMTHERCYETQTYINISHILQYWKRPTQLTTPTKSTRVFYDGKYGHDSSVTHDYTKYYELCYSNGKYSKCSALHFLDIKQSVV